VGRRAARSSWEDQGGRRIPNPQERLAVVAQQLLSKAQGDDVRGADWRDRVVGNLVTLGQAPSFWIQAICGPIILGSLMVTRFARGQSQE
jgi:hypothetical protein